MDGQKLEPHHVVATKAYKGFGKEALRGIQPLHGRKSGVTLGVAKMVVTPDKLWSDRHT